ncbi:hypothetical protein [Streptomyces phaeochromogenes]|uniref:hypothetical protein n=1 Tax=Streptomyces phaeochromogenes TaxID=1923 RepID=UPI003F4D1213
MKRGKEFRALLADTVCTGETSEPVRFIRTGSEVEKPTADPAVDHDTANTACSALAPARDHSIATSGKNYRCPTNSQAVLDVNTRSVVAIHVAARSPAGLKRKAGAAQSPSLLRTSTSHSSRTFAAEAVRWAAWGHVTKAGLPL